MRGSLLIVCALVAACGGANSHPTTPSDGTAATPPPLRSGSAAAAPAANASSDAPAAAATTAAGTEAYDDPSESNGPITLAPLLAKGAKPSFPKATVDEHSCWQTVSISGDAQKDFDALVAKCGTPTGSIEYVKPAAGKLHHARDKRDTFVVKIHGGLCYRFFGVADGTIKDLDVLIERTNGDLVGDDKTNGPVAIIESDKAWCMDGDGDYQFGVQVDGTGTGRYVFGVWARPNKK